jgi:hypothetical protein
MRIIMVSSPALLILLIGKNPNQSDIEDFFYDYDNRKAKSGWYFSVMPRLAFSSMVSAQAPFIGLKFEYRKYNWRC